MEHPGPKLLLGLRNPLESGLNIGVTLCPKHCIEYGTECPLNFI